MILEYFYEDSQNISPLAGTQRLQDFFEETFKNRLKIRFVEEKFTNFMSIKKEMIDNKKKKCIKTFGIPTACQERLEVA